MADKRRRGPNREGTSWAKWTEQVLKPDVVRELIEQAHVEAQIIKARNTLKCGNSRNQRATLATTANG